MFFPEKILWTEEPGGPQSTGLQSHMQLSTTESDGVRGSLSTETRIKLGEKLSESIVLGLRYVIRHDTQESAWRKAMLLNLSCYGTLRQVTHWLPETGGRRCSGHIQGTQVLQKQLGKVTQKWKTAALRQHTQILRRGRVWFPELPCYKSQYLVLNRSQTISRNWK